MVKLLVALGADPNLRDLTYRGTAIGWALYNGQDRDVIEYLLPFAGIVDAVRCGSLERVRALLQDDPSLVGAHDQLGNPLVFCLDAEMPRMDEMIRLLVAHGTDVNARDGAGKTILARALERGLDEFANTLRAHGGTT